NSPSGKQYIDNVKHKLIMKIPLEDVDLASGQLKKTPIAANKSHLEEDVSILTHITELAKTISVPHQQLDESIKDTIHIVNKHLIEESEADSLNDNKSVNVQLTINTSERIETIEVLFSSFEQKLSWERSFLEAKKALFDAVGRRNVLFQHVLTLPHNRAGMQFSCAAARLSSNDSFPDVWVCNSDGFSSQVCLVNLHPDFNLKACNTVCTSKITCVAFVPAHNPKRSGGSTKRKHHPHVKHVISGGGTLGATPESLLDIDSSDDDDLNHGDTSSIHTDRLDSLTHDIFETSTLPIREEYIPEQDTREATMWLGTEDGGLQVFQCTETMKTVARKSRILRQLGSSIYSILHADNKVFIALGHGDLCVIRRDLNGRWDIDSPSIKTIGDIDNPVTVMTIAAGKIWCACKDKIIVVCPNSLNVEHSFIVDECHRHVGCMTSGGASMHHVWIASQGAHEVRLFHATHYQCLLETSIKSSVIQKLQTCDNIIRAHKFGCLRITALHVCKDILWVGTSAGIILNIAVPQIDSTMTKIGGALNVKGLAYGHAGPVRFLISADIASPENSSMQTSPVTKTLVLSGGDGFEDYQSYDETLGKDDAMCHVILWQL
ncbi:unnamed protein product, partial [Didymodactylos carnosus]